MRDHEHSVAVVACGDVCEERPRPLDDLPVALSAGKRIVQVLQAPAADLVARAAVQLAVVALAKTAVEVYRDAGAAEGDLGRLDRATEVGRVDDVDVSSAFTERTRLLAPARGELPVEPARGDPGFVVERERVGLVDELDGRRQISRNEIGCAPSQSVSRPSSFSCPCPSTSVAKWFAHSSPALLLKWQ